MYLTTIEIQINYDKKGLTVMVNNSININKTNNHLSPKLNSLNTKDHDLPAWNRHKNVACLNQLMGSHPSILDNWISNGINKQARKYLHRFTFVS